MGGQGVSFLTNWNALNFDSSIILEKFYTITDVYVFEQNAPIQRITCLGQNIR